MEVGGECGFCFFAGDVSTGAVFARGGGVFFGGRQGGLCGGVRGGALFKAGELFALVAQGVVVGAGLLPAGLGGGEAPSLRLGGGGAGRRRLGLGFRLLWEPGNRIVLLLNSRNSLTTCIYNHNLKIKLR